MEVTFMEKIVKKKKTNMDYAKIAGIVLAVLAITFLCLVFIQYIASFTPILVIGSIWGAWWLITALDKEYEYSVTDNYLDIDCIIAKKRRVRVFSGDVKECEICARISSDYYTDYLKRNIKVLDFASVEGSKMNYFLITKNNAKKAKTKGQTVMVIFEPDDRMMQSLRKYGPSKIRVDTIGLVMK